MGTALVASAAVIAGGVVVATPAVAAAVVSKPAPVTSAPDLASAQAAARLQHAKVLIDDQTTATDRVWANGDGSLTREVSLGIARVKQSDGSWAEVDLDLVKNADGSITSALPAVPVTYGSAGSSTIAAMRVDGQPVSVGWEAALPEPVLSGTTARYEEVRPGVALVVEALRSGLEISFSVKRAPSGPLSLPLTMHLPAGADAAQTPDGGLAVTDAAGQALVRGGSPMMFGAEMDPMSRQPKLSRVVLGTLGATSAAGTGSRRTWTLTPDPAFFADPDMTWPAVVDPSLTVGSLTDTWIKNTTPTTAFDANTRLYIGTPDAGVTKYRTLLRLPAIPSAISGMWVDEAHLSLYNSYSASCDTANTPVRLYRAYAWPAGTTWNTQPGNIDASPQSTGYWAHGRGDGGSCDAIAWDTLDVTALARNWASGTATSKDFKITSNEVTVPASTATKGYKVFYSAEAGAGTPRFVFTYRAFPVPGTPVISPLIGSGPSNYWLNTLTPTFSATVTSNTSSSVQGKFQVWGAGGDSGTKYWEGLGTTVNAGSSSVATVPSGTLTTGKLYTLRVWGVSGGAVSNAWAPGYAQFQADLTAPATPSITSSTYSANGWQVANTPGSFTFSSPGHNDVQTWAYRFDSGPFTNVPGNVGTTDSATTTTITPPVGWQTLHVIGIDRATNRSTESTYSFGAGAAVSAPADGATTQGKVKLVAVAATESNQVSFSYKFPDQSSWTPIPVSAVTDLGLNPISVWPVPAVNRSTRVENDPLILDVAALLTPSGGTPQDGTVQLRAEFADSGTPTVTTAQIPTVALDQNAFGDSYATEQVGPGTVSLLTGNYSVSSTDASVSSYGSDLTLSRTFNSKKPAVSGVFGPGWGASLSVDDADSDFTTLTDLGGTVTIVASDASVLEFRKSGSAYIGQGVAEGLVLTAGSALGSGPGSFTLEDWEANKTVFSVSASWSDAAALATPHVYPPTSVVQPGSAQTTTYTYSAGRPVRMLAPVPAGVSCPAYPATFTGTADMGCRALDLTYATINGNQQITAATERTTDGTGAAVNVALACFTYDTNGRLSQAWDPRITGTTCSASPSTADLPTTYTYDGSGRLATIAPPGLAAWTLGYDGSGRFTSASRTHNANWGSGTETSTVVYGVPFGNDANAADGLHPDLSQGTAATWAQGDLPTDATAVFGPGDTVANGSNGDYREGTVHALNVTGREVNSAVYSGTGQGGWKVDTTEYDDSGRVVRSLTAANRDRALGRAPAEDVSVALPADTAAAARMLDSTTLYKLNAYDQTPETGTQLDVVDTFGPMHVVNIPDATLPEGSPAAAREHGHTDYDTGGELSHPHPSYSLHVPMSSWTEASLSPDVYLWKSGDPVGPDRRTTTYRYTRSNGTDVAGWTFRRPVQTTVSPGGGAADITTKLKLDSTSGVVLESSMPSDTGATKAGTTVTTYYAAGSTDNANCVNTAWVNLVCRTGPKVQISPRPAGMADLPVTSTTYDWLLRPQAITQTVTDTSGNPQTRTTTTTYENGGWSPRPVSTSTTSTLGTAIAPVTMSYDTATGLPLTTSGSGFGAALTSAYDDFGRSVSFTDADGAQTTTHYDSHGRPDSIAEVLSGATLRTTTLGYDGTLPGGGAEHRGLVTSSSTTGLGGAFTAVYDAGGSLTKQTFPNGITQTWTVDAVGDQRSVAYAKAGLEWFTDSQVSSIHGQWRTHDGLPSKQVYSYDGAGRLTNVLDTSTKPAGGSTCISRTYTFDVDSNRTALATAAIPGADAGCDPVTANTVSSEYDDADRLQPTNRAVGLVYNAFGRTSNLPAALTTVGGTGGAMVATWYYVNDLARLQTAGSVTRTWQLDATTQRYRTFTDDSTGSTITRTNHFASAAGDSPSWIDEGNGTHSRYAIGLDGNLAATTTYTAATGVQSTPVFQLSNLHGDRVTTATQDATVFDGAVLDSDEYGNPKTAQSGRYGWLGAKQRSLEALGGLTLMGVRLYSPVLGRFLSVDPVVGGNANAYEYCTADPINCFDLDGRWGWKKWAKRASFALSVTAMVVACTACAFAAAAISIGTGLHDVYHDHNRGGWLDVASGATFGLAKGLRYGNQITKRARMGRMPKGGDTARSMKRARQRAARQHRSFERRGVRSADRIDSAYGLYNSGSYAYSCYRTRDC